jgi:hypothetical protein
MPPLVHDKRIPWAQWQAAGYRPERVQTRQEDARDSDQTVLSLWHQAHAHAGQQECLVVPTAKETLGRVAGEEDADGT